MNKKLPISCFVIAQDESDRITNTIESVIDFVDEVIVIDSGSTDGTQDLAKQLGCKVFFNAWNGYGPQKRFGEDCARNEWLLNLDADEYLSDEIKSEILQTFDNNNNYNFFSMKVTPIYPNWKRPRLFSASHQCVRLYNKRFGRFSNSPVHDSVQTNNSKVFYFKNHVYHNSVRSFKHLIEKEESYIQLQSKTLNDKNKIFLFLRIFIEFPLAFIKYYFIRRHFTGALTGLITALILAYYRWKRVVILFKN
ncbi:glycosyltransferase family 2 protein [OCS116 cluster bacterium]|nr:glycosyltransferase family 2 protein [OCS116 cluster bacterium]